MTLFQVLFFVFEVCAQVKKYLPIPLPGKNADDNISYGDLQDMKVMLFGSMLPALVWLAKEIWSSYKGEKKKMQQESHEIYKLVHEIRNELKHRPTIAQTKDLIQKEIEYTMRVKRQ